MSKKKKLRNWNNYGSSIRYINLQRHNVHGYWEVPEATSLVLNLMIQTMAINEQVPQNINVAILYL